MTSAALHAVLAQRLIACDLQIARSCSCSSGNCSSDQQLKASVLCAALPTVTSSNSLQSEWHILPHLAMFLLLGAPASALLHGHLQPCCLLTTVLKLLAQLCNLGAKLLLAAGQISAMRAGG